MLVGGEIEAVYFCCGGGGYDLRNRRRGSDDDDDVGGFIDIFYTADSLKLSVHDFSSKCDEQFMIFLNQYPNSTPPHPRPHRTIRHALLPKPSRVFRKITIRRELLRQITLHILDRIITTHRVQRRDDIILADEVEEDEVDGVGQATEGGERGVGLDIVGLAVKGDCGVGGIVAVGAEVVGGDVAREKGRGLAGAEAARQGRGGGRAWAEGDVFGGGACV